MFSTCIYWGDHCVWLMTTVGAVTLQFWGQPHLEQTYSSFASVFMFLDQFINIAGKTDICVHEGAHCIFFACRVFVQCWLSGHLLSYTWTEKRSLIFHKRLCRVAVRGRFHQCHSLPLEVYFICSKVSVTNAVSFKDSCPGYVFLLESPLGACFSQEINLSSNLLNWLAQSGCQWFPHLLVMYMVSVVVHLFYPSVII